MFKKIGLILIAGLLLSACSTKTKVKTPPERQVRQLINALPVAKRPFLVVFPHSTGKLLTFYLDRVGDSYKQSTIDLEYLSGNSLKGGRTTIDLPKSMPYSQAFLLGSCSSGGKCSFDTDLISGNIKNKLDDGSETLNVLKSDFVFVNKGGVTSTDGRVSYTPTSTKQKDQIMMDTQGLPKDIDGELAYGPIAISAVNSTKIAGKLNFRVSGVTKVMIYDGDNFQPLKAIISEDTVAVELSQNPWNKAVTIIRDDLKGANETAQLYLLGPIILLK
ncbi:hypothetical protein HYU91_04240 [Candidatus Collierbacteria bacterium]|nr:hypothetical protein [Candidatus Collierbacteria bacterium]